jgi:hypothetical protein
MPELLTARVVVFNNDDEPATVELIPAGWDDDDVDRYVQARSADWLSATVTTLGDVTGEVIGR